MQTTNNKPHDAISYNGNCTARLQFYTFYFLLFMLKDDLFTDAKSFTSSDVSKNTQKVQSTPKIKRKKKHANDNHRYCECVSQLAVLTVVLSLDWWATLRG